MPERILHGAGQLLALAIAALAGAGIAWGVLWEGEPAPVDQSTASPTPGSLHVFKRLSRGNVAAVEVLIAGRDADTGLAGASALAQVPTRPKLLYVAAFEDNRVSMFEISVDSLLFRDEFED